MADKQASVGIGVEARVDQSVNRAFKQVEGQNKRLGRRTNKLKNDTSKLGNETSQTTRSVGRLGRMFNAAGKRVKTYTQNIGASIKKSNLMRRSVDKLGEGIDNVGNQWTALATGAAGAGSAVAVMGLEERYERLGIQAGRTKEQMDDLRQQMFKTSQQSDIRVDQGELFSSVEKIVEKTGDLKFAEENMANIGRVMQATGAQGVDVGEMFADMSTKFGLKNSEDVLAAIDTLVVQGKTGAFTLQNLAAEGASVSAAYAAMGRTGPDAVREMGALLQIGRMGSGSAAEAASSMESVLEDITANFADFEELGIEVFDQEALANGEKKFRSIPQILKEVMEATDGDITEYSQLFGDEAMRLLKALAGEKGKLALDDFLAISGDGTAVLQDSARAAQTANAAVMSLKTAWMSFADEQLAEPIGALADYVNSIDPENLKTALKVATGLAGTLGAVWAARKAYTVGKSVADFVKGPLGGGNSPDIPSGGVSKVYVTNMPTDGFGGGDSGNRRKPKRSKKPRQTPKVGSSLSRVKGFAGSALRKLPYLGAAIGALDIGNTLMNNELSANEKSKEVGGTVGQFGGMAAGAAMGAAAGSVIPIVGNVAGALIGGVVGGIGMEKVGRWVGGFFGKKVPKPGDSIDRSKNINNHVEQATNNDRSRHQINQLERIEQQPNVAVQMSAPGTVEPELSANAFTVNVNIKLDDRPAVGDSINRSKQISLNHQLTNHSDLSNEQVNNLDRSQQLTEQNQQLERAQTLVVESPDVHVADSDQDAWIFNSQPSKHTAVGDSINRSKQISLNHQLTNHTDLSNEQVNSLDRSQQLIEQNHQLERAQILVVESPDVHVADSDQDAWIFNSQPSKRPAVGDTINRSKQTTTNVVNNSQIDRSRQQLSTTEQQISKVTHNVNNQTQQQQQGAEVNFNPVFHVQGSVDDEQIDKLEQMVNRMAKQIAKLTKPQRKLGFADS